MMQSTMTTACLFPVCCVVISERSQNDASPLSHAILAAPSHSIQFNPLKLEEIRPRRPSCRVGLLVRAHLGHGSAMTAENVSERVSELKDEGNSLYKAGKYLKAAGVYSQAIKLDKENCVLYRWVLPKARVALVWREPVRVWLPGTGRPRETNVRTPSELCDPDPARRPRDAVC